MRAYARRDRWQKDAARDALRVQFLMETIAGWGGDTATLAAEADVYVQQVEGMGGAAAADTHQGFEPASGPGRDPAAPQEASWGDAAGVPGQGVPSAGAAARWEGGGRTDGPYGGENDGPHGGGSGGPYGGNYVASSPTGAHGGDNEGGEGRGGRQGGVWGGNRDVYDIPPGVGAGAYYASGVSRAWTRDETLSAVCCGSKNGDGKRRVKKPR